ncbi:MAG: GTP 3',8-cyclase MoaA [Terrimicrobiaceae bacterium]
MTDPFGRPIDYLRISVTDRCNERCLYCMPEGYKGWTKSADHLTAAQLVSIARAASRLGFTKFRLTGGEPLLRDDFIEIAEGIGAFENLHSLGVSTNGTRLAPLAAALAAADVRSANISLDALDPAAYRHITGGDLAQVLAGIDAALAHGLFVKLNTVLMRGVNEHDLPALVQFAAARRIPIRFIELMPLTRTDVLTPANFLSLAAARRVLENALGPLVALPDYRAGHGPARYHECTDLPGARIGFIGALSEQDFCASCNKLRLTADGKLRPCLGRHGELDLAAALANDQIEAAITQAIAQKPEAHEFHADYHPDRPMTAIGG